MPEIRRRVGRPRVGDTYQRIRITKEQQDELDMVAGLLGISRAEVVRRALAVGLRRMKRAPV